MKCDSDLLSQRDDRLKIKDCLPSRLTIFEFKNFIESELDSLKRDVNKRK